MKLYVWNNPYEVSYGGSCLYVIADSLRSARKLTKKALDTGFGMPYCDNSLNGCNVDKIKPSRVHKLPHAEMYSWSE